MLVIYNIVIYISCSMDKSTLISGLGAVFGGKLLQQLMIWTMKQFQLIKIHIHDE